MTSGPTKPQGLRRTSILRRNAEEILHYIPPRVYPADEGAFDGIMWHRAIDHGDVRADLVVAS